MRFPSSKTPLTDEERLAIDEAIAEGAVTVCPPRTYSEGEMYYDPGTGRVKYKEPGQSHASANMNKAASARAAARRREVAEKSAAGWSVERLALLHRVAVQTIINDLLRVRKEDAKSISPPT